MNQRIRVLQELGEQFERAVQASRASRPERSRRRFSIGQRLRVPPGAFAIASATVVSLGIALVVLLLVHPAHPQSAVGAGASEQSLLAEYSVLRRPQSATDRTDAGPAPLLNRGQSFSAGQGPTPGHETLHYEVHIKGLAQYRDVPHLTRVVKAGGVTVALFVEHLAPSTRLPKATVTGNDPQGAASEITPQRLQQLQRQTNGRAGYYLVARVGRSGRVREIAPGPSLSGAGGKRVAAQIAGVRGVASASLPGPGGRIVAVVPDGVARISWSWPREFDSQAVTYVPGITVSATVHENVAVAAAPARFASAEQIGPETVVRYAADGSVLARLTDPNNSAHAYQTKTFDGQTPGPETAQSRRAERNPATSSTVAVVPSIVTLRSARLGPGAQLFFKVLLNHRGYFLRLTGGPRAGCVKANPQDPGGPGYGQVLRPLGEPTVRGDTYEAAARSEPAGS